VWQMDRGGPARAHADGVRYAGMRMSIVALLILVTSGAAVAVIAVLIVRATSRRGYRRGFDVRSPDERDR